MIPLIIQLGPIPVHSFGLCVAAALLCSLTVFQKSLRSLNLPRELGEVFVFHGTFVGLLGARVFHLIENYSEIKHDFWAAAFSSAGFTFYGGFIFSFIYLFTYVVLKKLPLQALLDAIGPTLCVAYGVGRLGCQLSGDGDYGVPTQSWLGMSYAEGVVPTPPGVKVYPTPLYESTSILLIALFLSWAEKRAFSDSTSIWARPYLRFSVYLVLIAIERFLVESIRVNPSLAFGLSEAQLISVGLFFIGIIIASWALCRATTSKAQVAV